MTFRGSETEGKKKQNRPQSMHHLDGKWRIDTQYVVKQINIIVDVLGVLGGYSLEVRNKMKELFGEKKARECLMKMQKSILSSTLNIARCLKVMSEK